VGDFGYLTKNYKYGYLTTNVAFPTMDKTE
jgi:hypothetical protein